MRKKNEDYDIDAIIDNPNPIQMTKFELNDDKLHMKNNKNIPIFTMNKKHNDYEKDKKLIMTNNNKSNNNNFNLELNDNKSNKSGIKKIDELINEYNENYIDFSR